MAVLCTGERHIVPSLECYLEYLGRMPLKGITGPEEPGEHTYHPGTDRIFRRGQAQTSIVHAQRIFHFVGCSLTDGRVVCETAVAALGDSVYLRCHPTATLSIPPSRGGL